MPYASNDELPAAVRSAYSDRCQAVFRKVFNGADGDESSKFAQAHTAAKNCEANTGKAAPLDAEERDAWYSGRIPRPVRIIPFGGPIPSADGKGRDLDGEYFDDRTDIKPHWFSERPILWHHGADPTGFMGDTVLGKANNLRQLADGWWEDFWLKAGEMRLAHVRNLESKGGELFASSTPLQTPGVRTRRGRDGHIELWPHAESTLSTSPQNTRAIVRAAKAMLDDFSLAEIPVAALSGFVTELDDLGADLPTASLATIDDIAHKTIRTSTIHLSDWEAKAGRVLSASNEAKVRAALEQLASVLDQLQAATNQAQPDSTEE